MKFSFYNSFVPFDKKYVILYNACSGFYALLRPGTYKLLMEQSAEELCTQNAELYAILCKYRCIVEDDVDELGMVQAMRFRACYQSSDYQLIINPTMDCNLGCWYCYESHIKDSELSQETAERIIRHLHVRYAQNPFKTLNVSFFGGEPLLKESIVCYLLQESKAFCDAHNIDMTVGFTTNCTVLSDSMLNVLKNYKVDFQITLDGDKTKHDTVRHYKNSDLGSYEKIMSNLHRIANTLNNYVVCLRINCDDHTLDHAQELLDSIDFVDPQHFFIRLHKVWQVDSSDIDYGRFIEFIAMAHKKGIYAEFHPLTAMKDHVCYADIYGCMVVNYDGNVFKCTARKFSVENAEGVLTQDGSVLWNVEKTQRRMSCFAPVVCRKCKLYPSCQGFCSQHKLEVNERSECGGACPIQEDFSIDQYIVLNFQQRYIQGNWVWL